MKNVEAHQIPNHFFDPVFDEEEVINVSDGTEDELLKEETGERAAPPAEQSKKVQEKAAQAEGSSKSTKEKRPRNTTTSNGKKFKTEFYLAL